MTSHKPTLIDLFSGCGGLSRGFEHAGFRSVLALDTDRDSLDSYRRNHTSAVTLLGDIREVEPRQIADMVGAPPGAIDCIAGGPPCQSFSKNVRASSRFFEDPRNHLYRWFMDIVGYLQPKCVLIENVAELANAHNGFVREQICDRLFAMGYSVTWKRLLAADYGVPQLRRRVFFLASRIGDTDLHFPEPTHQAEAGEGQLIPLPRYVTVREAISDLPARRDGEGTDPSSYATPAQSAYQTSMRTNGSVLHDHVARRLAPLQLQRLRAIEPGQRMRDLPASLQTRSGYGGAYARLAWDEPALTITTWVFHPGSGRFGHPSDDRTITMREAARLQSFDDRFRFSGSYNSKSRQIGNAVPPVLAKRLAEVLLRQIRAPNRQSSRAASA